VFANPKGKVIEEYFFKFQENGDCFFLKENDGCYSCAVYETRPGICRNYPSKPIQKEACDANREKCLSRSFVKKNTVLDTTPNLRLTREYD